MPTGCLKALLFTAVLLSLSACVTTMNTPEQMVDLKKAEATHVQAGLAYLRKQDKEAARRHFLKAIEMNSDSAGAHGGMALLYQLDGEVALADRHFRRALSEESTYSLARNNYGAFLYQQKRYADAEKQLHKVVEDYTYERRNVALLYLGRTQLKMGKTEAAIKSLKQSLGINNRLSLAHLELAVIYFQQQEYTVARRYLAQFDKLSRSTARSLWLGIRLERIFGNKNKEASYALALKNRHPYSAEYLEYKKAIQR